MHFERPRWARVSWLLGTVSGDPADRRGFCPNIAALRAILVLCLAAQMGYFGYAAWRSHRAVRRDAEQRIASGLDVLTEHARTVAREAELGLHSMALLTSGLSDAELRARQPTLHQEFLRLAAKLPGVQSLWLIARDGLALVSDRVVVPAPIQTSDRPYFKDLAAGGPELYFCPVTVPRQPQPAVQPAPLSFCVAQRRTASDGSFNGVLLISLLASDVERYYAKLNPADGEVYEMTRPDGMILARHQFPALAESIAETPRTLTAQRIAAHPGAGAFTAASALDGVERIYGYRQVPGYPLYTMVGIPTASLRAAWLAAQAANLAIGLPAALMLDAMIMLAIQRTRRLQTETAEREAAQAALSRSQMLGALGQLTIGVAHDFNNLLTVILSTVDSLRLRLTQAADRRLLDLIEQTAQRGTGLVRQMLSFARRQPGHAEVIDLTQHLPRMLDILKRPLRGDIRLDVEVPIMPCPVRIDPAAFDVGLLNLVVNAADAMPNGGSLTIRLRPVTLDGSLAATHGLRGEFLDVTVADTGTGIAAATLGRVFEAYFTTKPADRGTGLGLSQVRAFAERAGGTVVIASAIGQGTQVTMYLPLAPQGRAAPGHLARDRPSPDRPSPERDEPGVSGRILLVEASADAAVVTRNLLQSHGLTVHVVASGRAALDKLQAGPRFDLVLLDTVLPGEFSGITLARELCQLHPDLPVLVASGRADIAERARRDGIGFIRKPYDPDDLRATLHALVRQHDPRRATHRGGRDRAS